MTADLDMRPGRSLPWHRVDNDFVDHPKTFALEQMVGDKNAGMYVERLWSYTMRFAPSGRHADGARPALERACRWDGAAGELIGALLKTGWLEVASDQSLCVHDWDEHQGAAVAKAQKDAERKRLGRETAAERRGDGAGTARAENADGAGNGTGRDETREGAPARGPGPTVSTPPRRSRRKVATAPDPEAELKRFAESLTDDEAAVFDAYEKQMGVQLGPDWGLKKFVADKLKSHHVAELCSAVRGHARDEWRRTNQPSLRAILRDASVIAAMAKKGAA